MIDKRQTILCVDDDPDDQLMVLDTILEIDPSFRVATAVNGMEALSFLTRAKERGEMPCLVIMDINMPLMDGKQALAQMKKDATLSNIPVVLFTTSSSDLDKAFAALHRVAFITKPINLKELRSTVKRLVQMCVS